MIQKIEIYPHGVLLFGFITPKELCEFGKLVRKLYKYDLIDCTGIAQRYGANFALVNKESHALWCKELNIEKD